MSKQKRDAKKYASWQRRPNRAARRNAKRVVVAYWVGRIDAVYAENGL